MVWKLRKQLTLVIICILGLGSSVDAKTIIVGEGAVSTDENRVGAIVLLNFYRLIGSLVLNWVIDLILVCLPLCGSMVSKIYFFIRRVIFPTCREDVARHMMLRFCLQWRRFCIFLLFKRLIAIVILDSHLLRILAIDEATRVALRSLPKIYVIGYGLLLLLNFREVINNICFVRIPRKFTRYNFFTWHNTWLDADFIISLIFGRLMKQRVVDDTL